MYQLQIQLRTQTTHPKLRSNLYDTNVVDYNWINIQSVQFAAVRLCFFVLLVFSERFETCNSNEHKMQYLSMV